MAKIEHIIKPSGLTAYWAQYTFLRQKVRPFEKKGNDVNNLRLCKMNVSKKYVPICSHL